MIKTGDKVGASEATLLNMLNISPFSYGLIIQQVYDNGSVYSPEVLDITEAALHARFLEVRLQFSLPSPVFSHCANKVMKQHGYYWMQDKLQYSLCSAVLSFPLHKTTGCLLFLLVCIPR